MGGPAVIPMDSLRLINLSVKVQWLHQFRSKSLQLKYLLTIIRPRATFPPHSETPSSPLPWRRVLSVQTLLYLPCGRNQFSQSRDPSSPQVAQKRLVD
jgi:hypothetical protein